MNTPSKIIITSGKTALLASGLLSLVLIIVENEVIYNLPLIFIISIIITFIISCFMILFTIVPIHELTPNLTVEQKFKRYFPLYAILFFLGCSCIILNQDFELIINIIFGIAYITAMQAWIWFFRTKK